MGEGTGNATAQAVRERTARIESLVEGLGALPDANARALCEELLDCVLELHGAALQRVLALLSDRPDGAAIVAALGGDEVISGVLLLHGLHPVGVRERVDQAVADCRAVLAGQGGDIELIAVAGDVVRLRVICRSDVPPATVAALRPMIERVIIGAAPEILSIDIDGLPRPPPPLRQLPVMSGVAAGAAG